MKLRLPAFFFVAFLAGIINASGGQPRWQIIGQLPNAISYHRSLMMIDGAVVTFGGLLPNGSSTDACTMLDPQSGIARPLTPMLAPRFAMSCVAVNRNGNTEVFVIGGYSGTAGAYASSNRVDKFTYNPATGIGQWRSLGTLDRAVGDCRADFDGNNSIVVTGGIEQTTGSIASGTVSRGSWRIDVATGSIQRLGDLTLPHASHSTIRYVDQLGRFQILTAGAEQPNSTTVTELLIGNNWDARTNPPRQWRERGTSTCDRGQIARVFGGRDVNNTATATCEWYDPKSGWRPAPRMNDARMDHALTRVEGRVDTASSVFVVGGRTTNIINSTELFSLPSGSDPVGSWESLPNLVVPVADASLAITRWNLPGVFGGSTTSASTNAIQVLQPLKANDVAMPATEVSSLSDSVILDVVNTWVLPVRIDKQEILGTSEFLVITPADTTTPIPAGGTRRYFVYFRPAAEGLRTGTLVFHMGPVADTVVLSGTGLKSTVSLTTAGIDMGEVIVSTQKDSCLPLVINQGTDTLRIDSMIVGNPDVSVVSPVGRVKVPPGETLTVCIRYKPSARGAIGTSVDVHIGARMLPVAVTGKGVRRFLVVQGATQCDTIAAKPGDSVTVVATILNTSDRTVRITDINVTSTNQGTVFLHPSMVFPIDVAPGASLPVMLIQQIVRESREDITITSVDNGDTLARGTICTVPRNRTLEVSLPVIDLNNVCGGTTHTRLIRIDNLSSIESITIDSVSITGINGSSDFTSRTTLSPRTSIDVTVTLVAPVSGVINGRVSFDGPNGSTVSTVSGTVAPTLEVHLDDAGGVVGSIGRQVIRAGTTTPPNVSFSVNYSWRLLSVRGVVESAIPLSATSTTTNTPGTSEINFTLSRAVNAGEEIAVIEYNVLRADALQTDVFTGPTSANPCVFEDTSIVSIDPFCGGSSAFVYLGDKPALIVQQTQPDDVSMHLMNIDVRGTMYVHDLNGSLVSSIPISSTTTQLHGQDLPLVLSFTFVSTDGSVVRSILIQRN